MSAHAPTIYPAIRYRDAPAGIEFLKRAFGFEEHVVYRNDDGTIAHAELNYGPSIVMIGDERNDSSESRAGTAWLYVAVPDADRHCERARAGGAEVSPA